MIEQLNWVTFSSMDPIHTTQASYTYSTGKGISRGTTKGTNQFIQWPQVMQKKFDKQEYQMAIALYSFCKGVKQIRRLSPGLTVKR